MKSIQPTEKIVLRAELRQFLMHPRALHILPLLVLGILAAVWEYAPPVGFLAAILTYAALEPQFNNIFFRTPLELEALSLFPYSWRRILRAKNIANMILAILSFVTMFVILDYFSPQTSSDNEILKGCVYFGSLLFPLLCLGNMRSLQQPRRQTGWQVDDLAECIGTIVAITILSTPYLLFVSWMDSLVVGILYCAGTAAYWHRSLAAMSLKIEERTLAIVEQT